VETLLVTQARGDCGCTRLVLVVHEAQLLDRQCNGPDGIGQGGTPRRRRGRPALPAPRLHDSQ
jgi:hypothetical protein